MTPLKFCFDHNSKENFSYFYSISNLILSSFYSSHFYINYLINFAIFLRWHFLVLAWWVTFWHIMMMRIVEEKVEFLWISCFYGWKCHNLSKPVGLFFQGRGKTLSCLGIVTILYFLIILSFFLFIANITKLPQIPLSFVFLVFFQSNSILRIKKTGLIRTCSDIPAPVITPFRNRSQNTLIYKEE